MCRECHRQSPDTRDFICFATWVKSRKKLWPKEIEIAIQSVGYIAEENDYILLSSNEFKNYLKNNSVIVGGRLAMSSLFAALFEFKNGIYNVEREYIINSVGKYRQL